jgi:hypothetical protein
MDFVRTPFPSPQINVCISIGQIILSDRRGKDIIRLHDFDRILFPACHNVFYLVIYDFVQLEKYLKRGYEEMRKVALVDKSFSFFNLGIYFGLKRTCQENYLGPGHKVKNLVINDFIKQKRNEIIIEYLHLLTL